MISHKKRYPKPGAKVLASQLFIFVDSLPSAVRSILQFEGRFFSKYFVKAKLDLTQNVYPTLHHSNRLHIVAAFLQRQVERGTWHPNYAMLAFNIPQVFRSAELQFSCRTACQPRISTGTSIATPGLLRSNTRMWAQV